MFSPEFDAAAALLAQERPDEAALLTALGTVSADYWDSKTHGTLLHWAAKYDTLYGRKARWARVLIETYGFAPNCQGNEGSTPALWAIAAYIYHETADLDTLKYLLSVSGFDVNARLAVRGSLKRHLTEQFAPLPRLQPVLDLLKRHRERSLRPLFLVRHRHRRYLLTR